MMNSLNYHLPTIMDITVSLYFDTLAIFPLLFGFTANILDEPPLTFPRYADIVKFLS
jgi:hypothetical protein